MKKKTSLPAKPVRYPQDPPPTKIRETVVADPSISFTIDLPDDLPRSPDGYYVKNFKAKIYLSDVPGVPNTTLTHVATIKIKSLSDLSAYIYVPFGDPTYGPGQQFTFKLKLRGYSPITGEPLIFNDNDNTFYQDLIGGGIVRLEPIIPIPPVKTEKKAKKK